MFHSRLLLPKVSPGQGAVPGPERVTIVPRHHYSVCAAFKREAIAVAAGWFAGDRRPARPVTGLAGTAGTGR